MSLIDTLSGIFDEDNQPFIAEGKVAVNDDPERRSRVQCVIPLFNQDEVYPVWARRMCLFVGNPGYGDFHYIELGASVVLFGRLGDTHNLFYAPLYTESYPIPTDFQNRATRGLRNDGHYKIITEGDLYIRAGRIILEADTSVRIIGPAGIFQQGKRED